MAKQVAVKAYSLGENAFWRSGKCWEPNGSVNLLEPLELARLRQEPRIVVVSVAESVEVIAEADAKAKDSDTRLLTQYEVRAARKKQRVLTIEYTRQDALKAHIDEIKADMSEDGTTADERKLLKDELTSLEQRLRTMIESQKVSK
jgi:flagellar biogenesis protein FliO